MLTLYCLCASCRLQKELGLPEDLLDKGRRKRVMHVPAGQANMHGLPYPGNSSNASLTSGNSSPVSLAALQSGYSSSSIPAAPVGELQSALTALQLEQQLNGSQRGTPTPPQVAPPGSVAGDESTGQRDIPVRPQSAPNLVAITEAEAAAAAAAAGAVVEQATVGVGVAAQPLPVAVQQQVGVVGQPVAAAAPEGPAVEVAVPACLYSPHSPTAASVSAPIPCLDVCAPASVIAAAEQTLSPSPPAAVEAAAVSVASPVAASVQEHQQLSPRPAPLVLPQVGAVSPAGSTSTPALVHSVSSPGHLQPAAARDDDILEQEAGTVTPAAAALVSPHPQAPAVMQVFNFAAPAAASTSVPAEAAGVGGGLLEPSPLPPSGKSKVVVSSTPTSPADSPSHTSSTSQQPPAWPGIKLQTGQVLPQLQGQQAMAVSTATAAATAAGMYPHPVAPRGARVPRLRRFSTEYGALSGSALQMQLEQLRLIQAQHSESAADGLVLHDVAAGDSCGSGAAAAAAVAAAAWGCVRRPRDRRLSNISILSGLSVMSSTSIDESGEDVMFDGQCSASNTGICSSEPSCQLWSPAHADNGAQEPTSGNGGTPKGSQPRSPSSQQAQI